MASSVSETLTTTIYDLMAHAGVATTALQQNEQMLWYRPDTLTGWTEDPADTAAAFDRSELNEMYVAAVLPDDDVDNAAALGSDSDLVVALTQIDMMSSIQRAYQARHLSRERRLAHVMGRLKGLADTEGPLGRGYLGHVDQLVKAGEPQ